MERRGRLPPKGAEAQHDTPTTSTHATTTAIEIKMVASFFSRGRTARNQNVVLGQVPALLRAKCTASLRGRTPHTGGEAIKSARAIAEWTGRDNIIGV